MHHQPKRVLFIISGPSSSKSKEDDKDDNGKGKDIAMNESSDDNFE